MGFEIDHDACLIYYKDKQEVKRVANVSLRIIAEVLPPEDCPVPDLKGFVLEVRQKSGDKMEIGSVLLQNE
jgi:hypothetical protein